MGDLRKAVGCSPVYLLYLYADKRVLGLGHSKEPYIL